MLEKNRHWTKLKWFFAIVFAALLILIGGFYIYTLDYYKAAPEALAVYSDVADHGFSIRTEGNLTILEPLTPNGKGLIFYPGGKVDEKAYVPLLSKFAQKGITCVLVKMPFHLAVLDVNGADKTYQAVPGIEQWYIGGHSLGGAMASSYAEKHTDKIKGLVLLASYPVGTTDLPTIAIYGSEDGVLQRDKLKTMQNVVEIPGGNHAGFGNYGDQAGDGKATISQDEQQDLCVDDICTFLGC